MSRTGSFLRDPWVNHPAFLPTANPEEPDFISARFLTELYLSGTRVSDVGLAHLERCANLSQLQISETAVSDAGLKRLKDAKHLLRLTV
jgi:hypothetical protein